MNREDLTGQRAVAIFFIAALAFSPVFLSVFSGEGFVFGVPRLFFYLFLVWGLVVLAIAVNVIRAGAGRDPRKGNKLRNTIGKFATAVRGFIRRDKGINSNTWRAG
ncbi:MAG: hypothetical protein R3245_00620 [Kiloniellales bacterium]|nr:hypothetical protein [Kiloniellales bacterium]